MPLKLDSSHMKEIDAQLEYPPRIQARIYPSAWSAVREKLLPFSDECLGIFHTKADGLGGIMPHEHHAYIHSLFTHILSFLPFSPILPTPHLPSAMWLASS